MNETLAEKEGWGYWTLVQWRCLCRSLLIGHLHLLEIVGQNDGHCQANRPGLG